MSKKKKIKLMLQVHEYDHKYISDGALLHFKNLKKKKKLKNS